MSLKNRIIEIAIIMGLLVVIASDTLKLRQYNAEITELKSEVVLMQETIDLGELDFLECQTALNNPYTISESTMPSRLITATENLNAILRDYYTEYKQGGRVDLRTQEIRKEKAVQ